jgi:hypothetical protein
MNRVIHEKDANGRSGLNGMGAEFQCGESEDGLAAAGRSYKITG